MNTCIWHIREGLNDSYWAFTPCKRGFNYLSRAKTINGIEHEYNGKQCPICGKTIVLNMDLVKGEE